MGKGEGFELGSDTKQHLSQVIKPSGLEENAQSPGGRASGSPALLSFLGHADHRFGSADLG